MTEKEAARLNWIAGLITFTGWCFLFYFNWKIGLAFSFIFTGFNIKRFFIDRITNNTIESMMSALKILVSEKIEKLEQEKLEEIKKN